MAWISQVRRERGRQKETLRRAFERERAQLGFADWSYTRQDQL